MNELTPEMQIVSGLIFTVGSLFFTLLLVVSYFSKERFENVQNKLYRYLLIVVIFLLVTEIIASLYYSFDNHSKFLYLLILKLHWSTGIIWPTLLYFYSYSFLKENDSSSIYNLIKSNNQCKSILVFSIVAILIYIFLPFSYNTYESFTYIPGIAALFIIAFCTIMIFMILGLMIFRAKNVPLRKKITIIVMIFEVVIIFGFQVLYKNIAFIGLGAAFQMYFLYFNIENPDLKIVSELETVKNDIEKSSRAKTDFLLNMSHKITTPMNTVKDVSQSIINNPNYDEAKVKEDINQIINAGNNLIDIVNNILDISKIESGKEILEEKEYEIVNLLSELSDTVNTRIGDKPIKMIVNIDNSVPSKLYGDYIKLYHLLLNILINSTKYTDAGKIVISITSDKKDNHALLHFKIADTGNGIKTEDFDQMFKKFSNSDSDNKLGLVITKKYVDLMGGTIRFESNYGIGTTFFVDIYQKIVSDTPVEEIQKSESASYSDIEYFDCSKYNILIVDDNKLNLKVAQRLMSKYNFNIETLNSGKECVYNIKAGKKYDMIFLDHMMPEMDGIRVLHILRKLEDYELPPIVALTANAVTGMKEMYLKEGFDEYLSKPISVIELNKLINKYFKINDEDR